MAKPVYVAHLITGLYVGGAETMLCQLLEHIDCRRFRAEVISLLPLGPLAARIQSLGVPVRSLELDRARPNPFRLIRLARWLWRRRPDIIQTWMPHSDLAGGLAATVVGRPPVVWGVHHTDHDSQSSSRRSLITVKTCARLSRLLAAKIVCCSVASREMCQRFGYDARKLQVIPNGFDLERFRPDPEARNEVRRGLRIPDGSPVVGLVARYHPMKDHRNFLEAACLLHEILPEVHFILCGDQVVRENPALGLLVEQSKHPERFHLLGRRSDIPRVLNAIDIGSLSSSGEAFPLVLGEAMACEKPCVATDVGDAARIVGDTGVVVPPRDPKALMKGWQQLIEMPQPARQDLGRRARQRIQEHFSIGAVVQQYQTLYEELVSGRRQ